MATLITGSGQPLPKQDSDYTPAAQSQVVSWQLKRLAPPSQLYVGVDDVLRVAAASSQTGEVVTVNYRLLRAADGKVVVGQFTVAPGSSRAIATQDNPLAEGFLLSASCQAAVATTRGQTFARLLLNPKALGAGQPAQMLMADYVTTAMASAYPNGRVLAPVEGPGWLHTALGGQPAAGLNWTLTVPSNARWRVIALSSTFTTDAVAGNRLIALQLLDPSANALWYVEASAATPPSFLTHFSTGAASFLPSSSTPANAVYAPMPIDCILPAGSGLGVFTEGIDPGDQWHPQTLLVEEWLDNV